MSLSSLDAELVRDWFNARYGERAPATWNRELATLRSAIHWWTGRGWLGADPTSSLARQAEPREGTAAITRTELEGIWLAPSVALREKALWRLLYETAGRAGEVLAFDIEELDRLSKKAPVRSTRGPTDWVFWQSGAAELLDRLLDGRETGPVFLADRQPTQLSSRTEIDPGTGRARLSYRRAAHLFRAQTGWTLHQLRHSALMHAAEDGVSLRTLLTRSRHASARSLERYLPQDSKRSGPRHPRTGPPVTVTPPSYPATHWRATERSDL